MSEEKDRMKWRRLSFNVDPALHDEWVVRIARGRGEGEYASGSELTRRFWRFYLDSGMTPSELDAFFARELKRSGK